MKLGTETGSVVNHLHSMAVKGHPEPKIGDGVTFLSFTDRHPGTVVSVDAFKTKTYHGWVIGIQEDHAKRTDSNGMSESQTYEYTPNTEAAVYYYRLCVPDTVEAKCKRTWHEVRKDAASNRWRMDGGGGLRYGVREKYYDFSF